MVQTCYNIFHTDVHTSHGLIVLYAVLVVYVANLTASLSCEGRQGLSKLKCAKCEKNAGLHPLQNFVFEVITVFSRWKYFNVKNSYISQKIQR